MKKLLSFLPIACCLLLFFLPGASASEKKLTFHWDQEISEGFAGWKIFFSRSSGIDYQLFSALGYDPEVIDYTTEIMFPSPADARITWYFVFTAFDDAGNESGYSNEVNKVIDFDAPPAPYNLTVTITTME